MYVEYGANQYAYLRVAYVSGDSPENAAREIDRTLTLALETRRKREMLDRISSGDLTPLREHEISLGRLYANLNQWQRELDTLDMEETDPADLTLAPMTNTGRIAVEHMIVNELISHLHKHGWVLDSVYDGEVWQCVTSVKATIDVVFSVDESYVRFRNANTPIRHCVVLVCGNGTDILADWTYTHDDLDGFDSAMEKFGQRQ